MAIHISLTRCREDLAIVAALHDVVEDSTWTLDGLADEGFAPEIVRAVDALTRREGESYLDYVKRAAVHPLARSVKEADLYDNRDEKRLSWLPEAEQTRLRIKYAKALAALTSGKEPPDA